MRKIDDLVSNKQKQNKKIDKSKMKFTDHFFVFPCAKLSKNYIT